jgi:DNA polymerase-1
VIEEPGAEADDVIATLARRARADGFEVVIVTGDKVDNVPGVPGVGEVTAAALIRHFGTVEEMLRRPEEIPAAVRRGGEKLRERILAHADRIRLNRRLVELRQDLAIPERPEELARRPVDAERARGLFAELEFSRLLKDLPPGPAPARGGPTDVLLTREALDAAVAEARRAGAVGIRAAFSTGSPRTRPPAGVAFAVTGRAWYLPLGHRYLGAPAQLPAAGAADGLRPLLEDATVPKHAHDLKAEVHAMRRLGLEIAGAGVDTELASRLLLAGRREHALADVARERLGVELPGPAQGQGKRGPAPEEQPVEEVADQAGASAEVLPRLAAELGLALEQEGLGRLYAEIERPLVQVLASMEEAGIAVDRAAMDAMSAEFGNAIRDLEARICEAAGHPFNVASTRELAQVLFSEMKLPVLKRMKTGPSTDQDVLEKLAEQHPLPRLVLEHRSLSKLKGTYVDALPLLADPADGRIHTTFNQGGAATGRLSSQDPNLQNIPIRTELSRRIRAAFVAPPGMVLLSADYSQIELRILAHYAEDPALLEAFLGREDVHARTAAETFGVAPGEVTPEMRRVAKVLNFGIAYGLSAFGLAQRLDLPGAEAQAIIDRYFARYAGVKRWLDATIARAREEGVVRTLFGRRRELPDIRSRNPGLRQAAERMAVNTPIQGTAADVIKIAMVRVDGALRRERLEARLLLQVHDELVLEVDERIVERVEAMVRREMEGAAALRVPLEVEAGHGRTWAEAH